jgi:two-component sensor histidine kinase
LYLNLRNKMQDCFYKIEKVFLNFLLIGTIFLCSKSFALTKIDVTDKNNKKVAEAKKYLTLSDSCKVKFDYKKATYYLEKSLSIYKLENDKNGEILCNIKYVEIYRHSKLFKEAALQIQKTEKLIKDYKYKVNDYNLMYFYNRKASIFSEYYKVPDSIIYYSQKALNLANKTKNTAIQFSSLMEIGYVFEQEKKLEKALVYYQDSFELAKKSNLKTEVCDALVNQARVLEKLDKNDEAIERCNQGLAILKNQENIFQELLFYDIKSNAYKKKGDIDKAYENLHHRMELTGVYYENTTKDELLKLELQNEVKEKEKEIHKQQDKINQTEKQQILLVIIFSLVAIGVISLLYYTKKIKTTNYKLDIISKENEFLVKETNHRINNNLQIIIILINEELKSSNSTEFSNIKKILTKVEAIATLHRHLYQTSKKSEVNINYYLNEIVKNFEDIFIENKIITKFKIKEAELNTDFAMYLGLLLTELFINSIKYAFTKQQEQKTIKFELKIKQSNLTFNYKENGENSKGKTINPKLIDKICRQLKVQYEIDTINGFLFSFSKQLQQ